MLKIRGVFCGSKIETPQILLWGPKGPQKNPRKFPQKNPADHHSHSLFEAMWEILLWESARSTSSTLVKGWGDSRGSLLRKQQQKNPMSNQVRMMFFQEAIRDFFLAKFGNISFQNGRCFARLVTPAAPLFFFWGGRGWFPAPKHPEAIILSFGLMNSRLEFKPAGQQCA